MYQKLVPHIKLNLNSTHQCSLQGTLPFKNKQVLFHSDAIKRGHKFDYY